MVSGTSVKITNVSQVRHESQDCLATAVKNSCSLCGNSETDRAATQWWTVSTCGGWGVGGGGDCYLAQNDQKLTSLKHVYATR